jgi:hypothetical protein
MEKRLPKVGGDKGSHFLTLKQWDQTENFLHPLVFVLIIGTNVDVVSP